MMYVNTKEMKSMDKQQQYDFLEAMDRVKDSREKKNMELKGW